MLDCYIISPLGASISMSIEYINTHIPNIVQDSLGGVTEEHIFSWANDLSYIMK